MTSKAVVELQVKNEQRILSFDDILGATDIHDVTVEVPEWGGSVVVRPLTKRIQRDIRREATVNVFDPSTGESHEELEDDKLELLLFQRGLVQPQITLEQAEQLLDRSASAFDRVLKSVTQESGLNKGAVTEAEKQFPAS
jgi:hypothetical protein